MRKFIPLSTFKELFVNQADLLSEWGMAEFKVALAEHGSLIAQRAGFTLEEFINYQHTLNDPTNVVFYGWIDQQEDLKQALLGSTKLKRFIDRPKYLEHSLSDEFKRFVSPPLAAVLLAFSPKDDLDLYHAFSFVQLLDLEHRAVVESKLFSS
ncbi:MAG: hypothetical protein ACI837_000336, partial [Crocinitomicaceae bacterium]